MMQEWMRKWAKSDIRNGIAVLFVLGTLLFIFVLIYHEVPNDNQQIINVIGGTVIGNLGLIMSYYFGSSKTDIKKEEDSE